MCEGERADVRPPRPGWEFLSLPRAGPANGWFWCFFFPTFHQYFRSVPDCVPSISSEFNLFTSFSWLSRGERNTFCTPNQRARGISSIGSQVCGKKESVGKETELSGLATRLKHRWDLVGEACRFQGENKGSEASPYRFTCAVPGMLTRTASDIGLEPAEQAQEFPGSNKSGGTCDGHRMKSH